ncbi:PPA1309 family protein [Aeromicrobium sp. UC242_57]|uniref:PPA1309 family protein n=1 Tax=Aeromicrobium sp. UC242_57 TaxID=3374624 RepID=UPI003788CC7E
MRAAGYTVDERPEVAFVAEDGASVGKLKVGDLVEAVDGKAVSDKDATVAAIGKVSPGDTVTLTVKRSGKSRDVAIVTKPDSKDPKIPRIGISVGTKFIFPIQVDNNVGDQIGGPSAGTMFALAIYDMLTPGELTGGKNIAGTGEITPDGVVGPIGGVRQKMAGAERAGATIFLVPAANCAEALNGDDDGLQLVKITKLDDAISSLRTIAKDPKAKVPSCLMPDSPLRQAALEVETYVGADGWDQAPRLFALVRTADLVAAEPGLLEQVNLVPDGITSIEQELPRGRELEDLLTEIEWPASVDGCAAVIERIMLPPEAEESLPDDPEALVEAAAAHPDRREARLVAAVMRDGQAHSTVRAKEPADATLLEGPDLVPGLIEHLRRTLT